MSFSFGSQMPQSSAPTFGASAPTGSITFGTPLTLQTTTSTAPTQLGQQFQLTTTTSTPQTGLFSSNPTLSSGTLGLGASANKQPTMTFNAPATSSTGFNLMPTTTTAASTGLNFNVQSSSSGLGLTGLTAASTSAAPSFNFGSLTPATTAGGIFAGLGGATTKPPATTTTTTAPVGLGGVTVQQKPVTTTENEVSPKEQALPNEILQTVEGFKAFVKHQKGCSSEVARCSVREFRGVEADIDRVNKLLMEVEVELQKNRALAEKLKHDSAKGLNHADIAQRTFNTPPGLQYNNVDPTNFFIQLADEYENAIQDLKNQIENTGAYVRNLKEPTPLTPQDLAVGMRRLHESFVALAGRLHLVHSSVEEQKEQYLNFRKQVLHDKTDVFSKHENQKEQPDFSMISDTHQPKLITGPTPFNNLTTTSYALTNVTQNVPPAYPGQSMIGGATSAFGTNQNTSLFGNSTFVNPTSTSFQLQQPPIGNKRGKLNT